MSMRLAIFALCVLATGADLPVPKAPVPQPAPEASAVEWAPEYEASGAIADEGRICVALAVYGEARGEGWDGQAAVATVIVNRARAARVDLCTVVFAPGQFQAVEAMPLPRKPWRVDRIAWNTALDVADAVLSGEYQITPPACARATSFHRAAPHDQSPCVIQNHAFTTNDKESP